MTKSLEQAAKEVTKNHSHLEAYFLSGAAYERERAQCLVEALKLIAVGPRPDGTYNRCREACEQLAQIALSKYRGEK